VNYEEYASKTRSQKIVLAQLHAREKLKLFDLHSGSIYKRTVNKYVVSVKVDGTYLTLASSNALNAGEYYYSPVEGVLYVRMADNADPKTHSIYTTYRFFYSNIPVNAPANITSGDIVHYEARIKSIGALKLELDYENTGIALESNSSISLENNDGYFDSIFDTLIWENTSAKFWSYNRAIPFTEAKLLYTGITTDKSFSSQLVKFTLKDQLSQLKQTLDWGRFSSADGEISSDVDGKHKRLIFGRVDTIRTTGINKIKDGFPLTGTITGDSNRNLLTGTVSGTATTNIITGTGTSFTTEVTAGDQIKIITPFVEYSYTVNTVTNNTSLTVTGTISTTFSVATCRNLEIENNEVVGVGTDFFNEVSGEDTITVVLAGKEYTYKVDTVVDATHLLLSDEIETGFTGVSAINLPSRGYYGFNRRWHVAGHKLRSYDLTMLSIINDTNIEVDNIYDVEAGDVLLIEGVTYTVIRVSGNKIRLNQALPSDVNTSSVVTKTPVNSVYVGKQKYEVDRDYSVDNTSTDAVIEFNEDAEFNTATTRNPSISFVFTNGSRTVTAPSTDVSLTAILKPRDWVRIKTISTPDWYEILSVDDTSFLLRNPALASHTGTMQYKSPEYIEDDSLVTASVLGLDTGEWIRYPAHAVKWLLEEIGLNDLGEDSFTQALVDCPYTLALYYPLDIGSNLPVIRDMITDINKSCFGSLYLDTDFNFTYSILNADKAEDLEALTDEDIINFSVTTKSNIYSDIEISYSPYVEISTQQEVFKTILLESDFVNEAIEKKETLEVKAFLYYEDEANTIAERWLFFKSLTQSVVKVESKLNLSLKSLNDRVYLNLSRLYKRFGGGDTKKIGIINSISKDGANTIVEFNDLGNVFGRVPAIAPNDALDYVAGLDDLAKWGYILDNNTETPDATSELELGTNLIG
jgi:hypothetical protein